MTNGSIFVIFLPHRHELDYEVNITTLDNKSNQLIFLERKTRMKYVGVLIDNSLSSAVAEGNKKSAGEGGGGDKTEDSIFTSPQLPLHPQPPQNLGNLDFLGSESQF